MLLFEHVINLLANLLLSLQITLAYQFYYHRLFQVFLMRELDMIWYKSGILTSIVKSSCAIVNLMIV